MEADSEGTLESTRRPSSRSPYRMGPLDVNPSCACCGRGMDILLALKEEVLKKLLGRITRLGRRAGTGWDSYPSLPLGGSLHYSGLRRKQAFKTVIQERQSYFPCIARSYEIKIFHDRVFINLFPFF